MSQKNPSPSLEKASGFLRHEEVVMQDEALPVNLFFRRSGAKSAGCELHWHEELEFYYVKKGGVFLLSNGKSRWLSPGEVGFVNWCEPHRGGRFLEDTEHYIIQLSPALFGRETVTLPGEGKPSGVRRDLLSLFASSGGFSGVFSHCEELNSRLDELIQAVEGKTPGYELTAKSAAYGILAFLVRSIGAKPNAPFEIRDFSTLEHLKKILAFLSAHCTEPEEVSLPALSARFGLSVPYLCRIFKKHTDLTLTAYVNELRCFRAASLIQGGASLDDAAFLTGFHDYNYFSRLFKKVMGMPPSACRNKGTLCR